MKVKAHLFLGILSVAQCGVSYVPKLNIKQLYLSEQHACIIQGTSKRGNFVSFCI